MSSIDPKAITKLAQTTAMTPEEVKATLQFTLPKTDDKGDAFIKAVNFFASDAVSALPQPLQDELNTITADMMLVLKARMVEAPQQEKRIHQAKVGGILTMIGGGALGIAAAATVALTSSVIVPTAMVVGALGLMCGNQMANEKAKNSNYELNKIQQKIATLQDDYGQHRVKYAKLSEQHIDMYRQKLDALNASTQQSFTSNVQKALSAGEIAAQQPAASHAEMVENAKGTEGVRSL